MVVVLSWERKKAKPSPKEEGLRLVMENVKVVEKEEVVLVIGSKRVMGLL